MSLTPPETLDRYRLSCPIHSVSCVIEISPELVEDSAVDWIGFLMRSALLNFERRGCDESCQFDVVLED